MNMKPSAILAFYLVCASISTFSVARLLQQRELPTPKYYFPLLNNNFDATIFPNNTPSIISRMMPISNMQLSARPSPEIYWSFDPSLNATTIQCTGSLASSILLPPQLSYASEGPFAVSFWAKPDISRGTSLEYIYSHTAANTVDDDSIQIFLPQHDHPSYGVVRTIVRDDTDPPGTSTYGTTYLDSNGCVSDTACTAITSLTSTLAPPTPTTSPTNKFINISDGQWHSITLSTHTDSTAKGYNLFIDGIKMSSLDDGMEYTNSTGDLHFPSGGNAMNLSGVVHLCSRADEDDDRYFGGSIAHLKIYDQALSQDEVKSLYAMDVSDVFGNLNTSDSSIVPLPYNNNNNTNTTYTDAPMTTTETDDSANDYEQYAGDTSPTTDPYTSTAKQDDTSTSASNTGGMSGGVIAGIVIASIGGALALATLLYMGVNAFMRRRRGADSFKKFRDDGAHTSGSSSFTNPYYDGFDFQYQNNNNNNGYRVNGASSLSVPPLHTTSTTTSTTNTATTTTANDMGVQMASPPASITTPTTTTKIIPKNSRSSNDTSSSP